MAPAASEERYGGRQISALLFQTHNPNFQDSVGYLSKRLPMTQSALHRVHRVHVVHVVDLPPSRLPPLFYFTRPLQADAFAC
jgi:hypothetical protein